MVSLNRENGFTLVELLVVVLIVGILAAVSIPQYVKTVESARADDAATTLRMIGTAHRMFKLDRRKYITSGKTLKSNCSTKKCDSAKTDSCQLVACFIPMIVILETPIAKIVIVNIMIKFFIEIYDFKLRTKKAFCIMLFRSKISLRRVEE